MLQRCLERGWRVVVQVGSDERVDALNAHLWTYDDASFLPHGAASDGNAADQPIWLTTSEDNPNGATVRFFVDGATTDVLSGYNRLVFLFDAADPDAVRSARETWKSAKATPEAEATYWRQDENGRWTKQG
jgi:DNA polymerase-3 subunit chi